MESIEVKIKTWKKDNYGLFDYESNDLVKNKFTINKSGTMTRDGKKIEFLKNDLQPINDPKINTNSLEKTQNIEYTEKLLNRNLLFQIYPYNCKIFFKKINFIL